MEKKTDLNSHLSFDLSVKSKLRGNLLVIQSGGPTAVINQSLAGIVTAALDYPSYITGVYGAIHGLHGLLYENFTDLSQEPPSVWQDISLSPGAALGSARIKPKKSDLNRVFEVLSAHNIQFLLYNGGNDSAEAAQLIREEANKRNYPVQILHIPKTIDNDLMETDHCPGFGSVARVVSHIIAGDDLDNRSFYNGIKINICMGRHAGWIAGATALAKVNTLGILNPEDAAPHLVYLPEKKFSESQFIHDVQTTYNRIGRATIVVAEGIADQITSSNFVGEKDEFGNAQLSGSGKLGDYLSYTIEKNLKFNSSLGKLRVRADTWGYLQRCLPGIPSPSDQAEAFWVGSMAVRFLMAGESDKMVTLIRKEGSQYSCETGLCDLALVAQKTKLVPNDMINSEGNGVTQKFLDYCAPLASLLPTVRTLKIHSVEKKCSGYVRE
jgi:ATP-dependent phosphofructokinase / diphosphate-dependent phosphofructokinase